MEKRLLRSGTGAVQSPAAVHAPGSAGRRRWKPPRARLVATVEQGFRILARLRRAPALHPRGLTCSGELEIVDAGSGPWDVPWLDGPGRYAATVRLSRAAGLPRRLPDGLGLAVRINPGDRLEHAVDLLLTSSGRGPFTRRLPLPRADALGGPYSSLLAYRIGGRQRILAAFPRPTRRAPVHGDPASLADALAAGPLVFELCADTSGGTWRPFGVLTVRTPLPLRQEESTGFDIYGNSVTGFAPGPALAAVRRAAYQGSRAGRGTRPGNG